MEKEYINHHNHSYIKILPEEILRGKLRYQYQILTTRKLEGFLSADFQVNNGEAGLYYDISAMQNLTNWFSKRKITGVFMEKLISSLQTALWSLEQYLMDERNLLLHPDCIFQNMETEQLYFMYCPYYAETETPDAGALFSFLTEHVDGEEIDAIEAIYHLYAKWENMKEQFDASTLVHLWPNNLPVKEEITYYEEEPNALAFALQEEPMQYGGSTEEREERKLYGNGRQNRRVIVLDKLPMVIGRRTDVADAVINDASIGKIHAKIVEEEGQIYLEDLNAPGGTFKNGLQLRPYERVELLREDEIKLGKLEFTYR